MRKIPFGKPLIGKEERKAVMDVLKCPTLVHGPRAKEFEQAFAKFAGAKFAISVSSCTAALHLIYFYLGLKDGDEVIVPAQTHTATAHAVELTGAKPVFVDAELETGNIDLEQIEAVISSRTKAISVVHFLGMPVDMDKLKRIAKKHNLFVVEDAALAFGTYYDGVHAGSLGDAGAFSFYPVKHITTAEGGILTTKHSDVAEKIERQKAFGVDRHTGERKIPGVYDVTMLGFNYRMNELEAALGIEQLKKADYILGRREENYMALKKRLEEINELTLLKTSYGKFKSSYYCLSALLNGKIAGKRFELVKFMNEKGIGTSVYYPRPVPHMTYYKEKYGYSEKEFPRASRISYTSIALPVGPHLDGDDMKYIADTLKQSIKKV
jgi:dTDP-4-amino-4,6-dideoxygalactose transaminase